MHFAIFMSRVYLHTGLNIRPDLYVNFVLVVSANLDLKPLRDLA